MRCTNGIGGAAASRFESADIEPNATRILATT